MGGHEGREGALKAEEGQGRATHVTCQQRGHDLGGGEDSHRSAGGVTGQRAPTKTRFEALNLDTFLCL